MKLERLGNSRRAELSELFRSTFSDSEGEDEGLTIGRLVDKLAAVIDDVDVIAFGAIENGALTGAIFFTRLKFSDDSIVYMLAPVAVSSARQRSGIGQALIEFGLQQLKKQGAGVVVTYGDPAYYGRAGFEPLSENVMQAPMELSMPQGWLGQSLSDSPIEARSDRPNCVEAFRDPAYW
ncbi:GNAT family N-acetyltransferase [Rubrivivax albus]|uniref:N-acetyltransferase n=1 Tax=Rubrivivax albus TaxID=2499835 RepID=A0A437JL90_9BURK|nr:N-acetyltransferase [Rubrivivax albus]RVT47430.1 N-acetyltransferase [Rubrivivax albus]